jgi:uncharacterized Zn finger protein (UPF0148 family)
MFDELIRELRGLDGRHEVSVSVTIPSDADGYFDRECPSSECQFEFKIHEDDWRDKVRDEEVFCPFCGHTADSDAWWTQDQLKHTEKVALAHIDHRINGAMKRDADRWNRRQPRNSFISMTMKVDSRLSHFPLPPAAVEPMRLKITCPECESRYAVIGAAFFCPACGHNAADMVFTQTITGIRQVLDALAGIRATVPDRDTAETTVRLIIENGLQNAVTAFQRFAEALYGGFPSVESPRRNAFQNLRQGSELWVSATGKPYSDHLNSTELNDLTRFFQQRHLLAHTQGIVDAEYIERTGDTTYREGQRLVIREAAVRNCLTLIEKLAAGMAADEPQTKETET